MIPTPTDARQAIARWQELCLTDWVDDDPHLRSLLRHHGRPEVLERVTPFGRTAASLDDLVRDSNRDENLPRLRRYDGLGNRIEQIDFHPSYHELGRVVYGTGMMTFYGDSGRELESLTLGYLYTQNGEAGHGCPLACTAGLIKILQHTRDPFPREWLDRLLDPSYDTHFHAAQFLTEIQGGSDVGANALAARPAGDGTWRLHGEKWFCSVVDAHLYLVTARPDGAPGGTRGVQAFVVPRTLPDGRTNDFRIRRLKYKLGTRSMASAELDFEGATAWRVGDFRDVVEVVLNTSRLHNAVVSCAFAQRAYRDAASWAVTRTAFGEPILAFPGVARVIASLKTTAYALRASTFLLLALSDAMSTGKAAETDIAAFRMLVNLNKYWTSHTATTSIRDAIEVLGGNGAIEEFSSLARLLRDSIVTEAWEGGHNVLCAQVLRDSFRLGLHEPLFAFLEERFGTHPRLAACRTRWEAMLKLPPDEASARVRDLADQLAPVVQALALQAEAAGSDDQQALEAVAEHLLVTTAPGYDPLDDADLPARVRRLVS